MQPIQPKDAFPLRMLLEAVAALAWVAMVANLYFNWDAIPAEVPRHFNAAGEVERWGAKNGLLVLPLLGAGLWMVLTIVGGMTHVMNVPFNVDRNDP